ncbi:MAG: hypothetical protein ACTSRB_08100 [Candidatus Helarchaeota archaeon]
MEGNKNRLIISFVKLGQTVELIENIAADLQGALSAGEETSAAMEQINSSVEQQTASMEEITATAARLGELSENLKDLLVRTEIQTFSQTKSTNEKIKEKLGFIKRKKNTI